MTQAKYAMKIYWGWGNPHRFNESYNCVLNNLDEVDDAVRYFLDNVATRYTYDCGDKNAPLYPTILNVKLVPYTETIEIPYEKIEEYQTYLNERGKSQ